MLLLSPRALAALRSPRPAGRSRSPTSASCRAAARRSARTSRTAPISPSTRSTPRAASSAARSRSPHADTQSNPGVARAQVQKALDGNPYVLLGPGFSGSVKVTASLAQQAGIAQIMGGEAAELTQTGNPYLFRTSFGQQSTMPKVARLHRRGREGEERSRSSGSTTTSARAAATPSPRSSRRAASRSWPTSRPRPARPTSPPTSAKAKAANADAIFVYLNEEESARILRELRRQNVHGAADRRDDAHSARR